MGLDDRPNSPDMTGQTTSYPEPSTGQTGHNPTMGYVCPGLSGLRFLFLKNRARQSDALVFADSSRCREGVKHPDMPLVLVIEGLQVCRRLDFDLAHVNARVEGGFRHCGRGQCPGSEKASRDDE